MTENGTIIKATLLLFIFLFIFLTCILALKRSNNRSNNNKYNEGIQEGIRITREEAVEKRLGYFIITNKLTGASAFYWLSREGTNNLIQ